MKARLTERKVRLDEEFWLNGGTVLSAKDIQIKDETDRWVAGYYLLIVEPA